MKKTFYAVGFAALIALGGSLLLGLDPVETFRALMVIVGGA